MLRVRTSFAVFVKENPDLRGLGGCWAVVVDVSEFSCLVHTWRGEISVRIENLELRDYSPQGREEMSQLCDRISKLREAGALDEEFVWGTLAMLGKLKRPFLTDKEEAVLGLFEKMFGVS